MGLCDVLIHKEYLLLPLKESDHERKQYAPVQTQTQISTAWFPIISLPAEQVFLSEIHIMNTDTTPGRSEPVKSRRQHGSVPRRVCVCAAQRSEVESTQ